jgi:hypothetical protein
MIGKYNVISVNFAPGDAILFPYGARWRMGSDNQQEFKKFHQILTGPATA